MRMVKHALLAVAALLALTVGTGISTASASNQGPPDPPSVVAANAATKPGGPITRKEVIRRAKDWVNERVPYSETSWHHDRNGTYRQDCSGYVSMAWHLPTSMVTWTLPQVATRLHSLDDLRQGDMIDKESQHVVLFDSWVDSHHTVARVYEEAHRGTVAQHDTYGRNYLIANGFHPYRYRNIR
jgi:hypothetical protein